MESTLNNWLKLGHDIPVRYVVEIEAFLGVSLDYLLMGSDKESITNYSDDAYDIAKRYDALDKDGQAFVRVVVMDAEDRMMTAANAGKMSLG